MDLEATVRELKADLKNAREHIGFLTENMKSMKSGRDEELHAKMDEILKKLEKQQELEMKVDVLTVKVENMAETFLKSKEMKNLIDAAVVTDGYLELFAKDFDKIHREMQEIKATNDNMGHGNQQISQIDRKLDDFSRQMDDYGSKLTTLKGEMEGNRETIPIILKEMKDQRLAIERIVEAQKVEFGKIKVELDTKWAQTYEKSEDSKEITYRCWNSNCHSVFPKNIELREDGVSVYCPNVECRLPNIVGKLKEGHKWMTAVCNGKWHLQQFPLDIKHGTKGKCQVCGEEGTLIDRCNVAVDSRNIKLNGRRKEAAGSTAYKCLNFNCNYIFPKNLELEEDGVSISCPNQQCGFRNIIGKLKEHHRWMAMSCNGKCHFQQFPLNQKHGEMAKCQVCGTEGVTIAFGDHTAVCI